MRALLAAVAILTLSALQKQAIPITVFDCTAGSARCPEVTFAGDRAAKLPNGEPSPFRGFADPSLRRDPATGRLWMAHSWPNVHVDAKSPSARGRAIVAGVDIHLASSDDGVLIVHRHKEPGSMTASIHRTSVRPQAV